ncbi:hypothetical protein PENTCL1PPCAC_12087, partial [Pristionchus entomophagus]
LLLLFFSVPVLFRVLTSVFVPLSSFFAFDFFTFVGRSSFVLTLNQSRFGKVGFGHINRFIITFLSYFPLIDGLIVFLSLLLPFLHLLTIFLSNDSFPL